MRASKERGYTLIELVIVVSILALIAAIAVPAATSSNSDKELELVAEEFASAIRFTRSESIRTGMPHGFRYFGTEAKVAVYRVDTSGAPWSRIYDVHHPITKQLHSYTVPAEILGSTGSIDRDSVYHSTCDKPRSVYFDANGTPWCLQPETALLDYFELTVNVATQSVRITVDGITGRVTVQ